MNKFAVIVLCLAQLACGQATTGLSGRGGVSGTAGLGNGTLGVSSISISPLNAPVVQGSIVGYTATALLSNGATQNVTSYSGWSFSSPSVASRNSLTTTLNALCISPGTTQVIVQYARHSASTTLTCIANSPPVVTLVSMAVSPASPSINVGTSQGFTATGTYSDGTTQDITGSVTWNSSNTTNVQLGALSATQDADCIHGGTSTVKATDGATAIFSSTVLTCNAVLASLNVSPASASILAGFTQAYIATCNFNDGSSSNCTTQATWSSSATAVATIPANPVTSPNTATGLTAGSSTITAAVGIVSGTSALTVTQPAPHGQTLTSIAVTPANKTINAGGTLDLIATGTYSDGTTQNVSALDPVSGTATVWTSSNTPAVTLQLADAIAGNAYSKTLPGTGSTPHTWSVPAKTAPAGAVDMLDGWWLMARPDRDTSHMAGGSNPRYSVLNAGLAMGIKSSGGMPQDGRWYDDNYLYFGITDNGDSGDQAACVAAGYAGGCFLDPFAYKLAQNLRPFAPRYFVLGGPDVTINDPAPNLGLRTTNCGADNQPLRDLGNVATVTHDAGTATNWGGSVGNAHTVIVYYYRGLSTLSLPYQSGSRETYYMAYPFGVFKYESANWNGTAYSPNTISNLNNNEVAGAPPTPNFGCGIPTPPVKGLPPGIGSVSSAKLNLGDSTGTISGTPNAPGTYPFIAQEKDGSGAFHLFPNTIRVAANAAAAQQTVNGIGAGVSTITATIGAVSGNTTVTVQNPPPTLVSIAIAPPTASILTTDTQTFIATGTFSDGSSKDVTTAATWSSSNTGVAIIPASPTVSPNTATPVLAGSTTITAAIGAISGTASLTVTNPGPPPPTVTGVTLAPKPCSQLNGASCSYTLTANYSDGSTKDVTLLATSWVAGTPATVQMASPFTNPETGKCLVGGGATSTVTGSYGGFSDNTTQTCTTATPTLQSVAVTPANQSIYVGALVSYTATGTYSDGSTKDVTAASTWSSSNTVIAAIQSPGVPQPAKCNAAGTATIRATNGAVSGTTNLTCVAPPCGPPGYTCSSHSTVIATVPATPNVGTTVGVNSKVYEYSSPTSFYYPTSGIGNCVTRLTDANSSGGYSYGATASGGANELTWSSDNSYMSAVKMGTGTTQIISLSFDGAGCATVNNTHLTVGVGGETHFSRITPNIMYRVSIAGTLYQDTLSGTNPVSLSEVSLFDFRNCPGFATNTTPVTWIGALNISDGDAVFSIPMSTLGNQGTGTYVLAYKPGSGCSTYKLDTGNVYAYCLGNCSGTGSNPAPIGQNTTCASTFTVHGSQLAHNGTATVISGKCTATTVNGLTSWTINTTTGSTCDQTHFQCGGHDSAGYSHLFARNGAINIRPMTNMTTFTNFFGDCCTPFHSSYHWLTTTDTEPWLGAVYNNAGTQNPLPPTALYQAEVMAWRQDGTTSRFGYTYNSGVNPQFLISQNIPNVSMDGKCIAFGSDWENTMGTDVLGNRRGDMFAMCNLQ